MKKVNVYNAESVNNNLGEKGYHIIEIKISQNVKETQSDINEAYRQFKKVVLDKAESVTANLGEKVYYKINSESKSNRPNSEIN